MPSDSETHPSASELQRSVQRVFEPLDADQQQLVNLVGDTFVLQDRNWPTFQFVEAMLDRQRLDARSIIASFPWVGNLSYRYGAVRSISWAHNMGDSDLVRLSLVGLHHYRGTLLEAGAFVRQVLEILELFATTRRSFRPSPLEVERLELTDREVADYLRGKKRHFLGARALYQVMQDEPVYSGGWGTGPDEADFHWTWTVSRSALDFEGVTTMQEYVQRVAERYHLAPSAGLRTGSPRSLASALDHLDVVWRLLHGKQSRLVVSPSLEITTLLGSEVASRADYFEHINALGDVFKHLKIPSGGNQRGGHPLDRLRAYLEFRLPNESVPTATEAIDVLTHVKAIRNGSTHAEAMPRALEAYRALDIAYPITDWGGAWLMICGHTVAALDSIRNEVLSLIDEGEDPVGGLPSATPH